MVIWRYCSNNNVRSCGCSLWLYCGVIVVVLAKWWCWIVIGTNKVGDISSISSPMRDGLTVLGWGRMRISAPNSFRRNSQNKVVLYKFTKAIYICRGDTELCV